MKEQLKYTYIALVALLLNYGRSAAQQQHKEYSLYNGETLISAPESVTLKDGFFIPPPPAGTSVRIFTTGISYIHCQPFATTPLGSNGNYILTRIFKVPGVSDANINDSKSICEESRAIQYFDGLGRPLQNIQVKGSPGFCDIVQPIAYDAFGRESTKYQPYSLSQHYGLSFNNGAFRTNALTEQLAFYTDQVTASSITATNSPFSVTVFEPSPLNRVLEQGAPGDVWQPGNGHTLRTDYKTNIDDEVKRWTVNTNNDGAIATYYDPSTLYRNITRNENWVAGNGKAGTIEEFKDLEDRVVMKRIWETDAKSLDTYYVYDGLGNLGYVLPPAVNENTDRISSALNSFTEDQTVFKDFIYGYHYDVRGRLVEKKVPGKDWEYIIYNKLDQVVLTQDANQRNSNSKVWSFSKYDVLGRPVITGMYNNNADRTALQATVDVQSTLCETRIGVSYDGLSFPNAGADVYTINYYDSYDFDGNNFGAPVGGQASGNRTKGLLTGSKVRILGTNTYLLTVNYYDNEGRLIQIKSENHLGGTDIVDNNYNFAGELVYSGRIHTANNKTTTVINRYEYDHSGRKIATFEQIDGGEEITLNRLLYDEVGQLRERKLHNNLQSTTFTYNERGWLKSQANPLFNMTLNYDDHSDTALKQYNGNISGQSWGAAANPSLHQYAYSYDKLNRLIQGTSEEGFNETIAYDVMGNITNLARNPMGTNTYNYANTGNRLNSISGFVNGSYGYDDNGNLVNDGAKGITVQYNHLNLPQVISKSATSEVMTNTFLATGAKLSKVTGGLARNYVGGIEYNNGTIEFIQTEEGRARPNGSTYFYEYTLKDHLGNTRVMFDQNGTVLETSDYYPFGLQVSRSGQTVPSPENRYKYNGKELQTELGLNQYDYGARFYDPVIGRWTVIDPKSELLEMSSPYVYSLNSPVNFIDKDGELPIYINGKTSNDNERGDAIYWNTQLLRTIASSGIPNPGGTSHFVDGNRYLYRLANDVRVKNSGFTEGQVAEGRREAGYRIGKEDFQNILSQLAKDPKTGKITEKIQIYTHSRGAAFGAGYAEALLEMIKKNSGKFADANNVIDYVLNLAPHQSDAIDAPRGANSFSIDHDWDMLSGDDIGNNIGFKTNTAAGSPGLSHQNKTFSREVGAFIETFQKSKGNNNQLINEFIRRMKSYGIKVTVN